jgi:2-polyprenyl-3-methyl-5-hydroxy-6-metoxy-1,4-benzoquinol methylase
VRDSLTSWKQGAFVTVNDLRAEDNHFAFGKNWASYAELIDEGAIDESKKGLLKFVSHAGYEGRTFLDIGCGSGLHALAAIRLGISRILAVDIDAESVATTRKVLSRQSVRIPWQAEHISVFDLDPVQHGHFDIVYSWGVLHHTGSMWAAVRKAAGMVAPGGLLILALYRTTPLDGFWKREKRWYAHAYPAAQRLVRGIYLCVFWLAHAPRGSFRKFVAGYRSARGMDFYHDVHDWLGGYPYETALASEVEAELTALGFKQERVFVEPTRGILSAVCDEYVYRLQ